MAFIKSPQAGEAQIIRLTQTKFFDKRVGEGKQSFMTYRYTKVLFYGSDRSLRNEVSPPADDTYQDWTYSANQTVHNLIQSVGPTGNEAFTIQKPTKQKSPYRVWVLRGQRWEELKVDDEDAFDPNADTGSGSSSQSEPPPPAEYSYEPVQDGGETHQQAENTYSARDCRGALIVSYIASSLAAGTSHPELRSLRITEEQATSLMIAASTAHGGRFGDKWATVDLSLLKKEMDVNFRLIANNGLHPQVTRPARDQEGEEGQQGGEGDGSDDDTEDERSPQPLGEQSQPNMSPASTPIEQDDPACRNEDPARNNCSPSEGLLAYWQNNGFELGTKDPLGRTVTDKDGLPI